jgi:acyl-CoA dehydrogenase
MRLRPGRRPFAASAVLLENFYRAGRVSGRGKDKAPPAAKLSNAAAAPAIGPLWPSLDVREYLSDPAARDLSDFFQAKGLAQIKQEDGRQQWYSDWIAYQSEHRLYARMLAPSDLSTLGGEFDLPRYARFLELFAWFSPAHGYSLQVTFLGLFPVLMGNNAALKREAVNELEAGGIFGLAVSEKAHGADLLSSEFVVSRDGDGPPRANGSKYYIGNCNAASMMCVLARTENGRARNANRRAPFLLFALRPRQCPGFGNIRRIGTLGVRAAYVGEFEVRDHPVPAADVIAEGRDAWDAVLGTVTLGKFFLGFGAIGICEHALEEAVAHLSGRNLYGNPAIEMPHIRRLMSEAYARLAAMKFYAYRALDYVRTAGEADRRYVLFCAVQKAKVSTEAVRVMAMLSECVGARGFEADTYFEMALRDVQLFPGVEGSTHINLALAAQFIPRYFKQPDRDPSAPGMSGLPTENPYLMRARSGAIHSIAFASFEQAYLPLKSIANVRRFAGQVKRLARFFRGSRGRRFVAAGTDAAITSGKCLATIAYAQLIAERCACGVDGHLTSMIFGLLISDISHCALEVASSEHLDAAGRLLLRRAVATPRVTAADLAAVSQRMAASGISTDLPHSSIQVRE